MYYMKTYPKEMHYNETFHRVLHFLCRLNDQHRFLHFHWARWEWMFARESFSIEDLSKIKIFVDKADEIHGLFTFEDEPNVWFMIYDEDKQLKEMMLKHFLTEHSGDDLIIPNDHELIEPLKLKNYYQTEDTDPISIFKQEKLELPITRDYVIQSLDKDYRLEEIHFALWYGFNHQDPILYSDNELMNRKHMTSSPHFKKNYTFVAVHENHYVSYAGIWYIPKTKTALIEPVATIKEHRRKDLAKACVYKAIIQAKRDGAQDIFVGSDQLFYHLIGFELYHQGIKFKQSNKRED